jgi:hypothetical protein
MSRGNFDLVRRVSLDYTDLVVSKWKSRKTGLSVVHMDYDGETLCPVAHRFSNSSPSAPIVNGYFVIATESEDLATVNTSPPYSL